MTYVLRKNKNIIIFSLIVISLFISYVLFKGNKTNTIPEKADLVFNSIKVE